MRTNQKQNVPRRVKRQQEQSLTRFEGLVFGLNHEADTDLTVADVHKMCHAGVLPTSTPFAPLSALWGREGGLLCVPYQGSCVFDVG